MRKYAALLCCVFVLTLLVQAGYAQPINTTDESLAQQFHQFDPSQNNVTYDIAYYSMIAYYLDYKRTEAKLRSYPKIELQALSLLLTQIMKTYWDNPKFEDRPMSFYRSTSVMINEVQDLAGLRKYSEVITGRMGSPAPPDVDLGAAGAEVYIFYPDGNTGPRIVTFWYESTIGMEEGFNEVGNHLRLYMMGDAVGKIEYQTQAVNMPTAEQIAPELVSIQKTAEHGDSEAQYLLGTCYLRGEGVRQDNAEAAKWFEKAAQQGHAKSQLCLGVMMYADGLGDEKNNLVARYWFEKSAEQGNTDAASLINEDITQEERETIFKRLDSVDQVIKDLLS